MPDSFEFSKIGQVLSQGTGIGELMDDLGRAFASGDPDIKMLGGGQPSLIPELDAVWHERWTEIGADKVALQKMLSIYDGPSGCGGFRTAVAGLLNREFGWDVAADNIAITPGGQSAFFYLFNMLAGPMPDGSSRKVLLPLVPEYIGYSDQGLQGNLFQAIKPTIEEIGDRQFKYHIDFDALEALPKGQIGAVCVSRPTNPSGNVLTNAEIDRLAAFAESRGVPLIIDNAYGAPFPGILFREIQPFWNSRTILTLSLSKLGLPGTRTGIVVAPLEIAAAISSMNAVVGLANNNIGQAITLPLIESGRLLKLSSEVIQPFYKEKSDAARSMVERSLPVDVPWRMHVSEGALFLWLWFPGLPISSKELYALLKEAGVLVVPGEYFFFGIGDDAWPHRRECIRISYAMDTETVETGIERIGEVVRNVFLKS